MAKAVFKTVEVSPAIPAKTEQTVTLTLTMDEAQALRALTGQTNSDNTARVWDALFMAGVKDGGYTVQHRTPLYGYNTPGQFATSGTLKVVKR